ncbi:gamma carbonic anhydrase family protein, partial [Methanocorpusculum sp.]|nr:gamma carbonic anhydrase family protein [Methanocorpusculum sp.]
MDFGGRTIGNETYVAPNATLAGDVHLGDNVTILFGAVLRADMDSITIG